MDEAIKIALNTFEARINSLDESCCVSKEYQALCEHTKVNCDLRFGFTGGWVTMRDKESTMPKLWKKATKAAMEFAPEKFNGFTEIYSI